MSLPESLRIALASLRTNQLRAILTMLGIVIGVAAMVALLAIGRGVQNLVSGQLEEMGTNLVFVFAGTNDPQHNQRVPPELTNADVQSIANPSDVPAARQVVAEFTNNGVASYVGASHTGLISGVTANYWAVRNARLARGTFFDQAAVATRARVAVLGANPRQTLFPNQDPIGRRIRINGLTFEVIGVMEARGAGFSARDDDKVYVPLTAAQSRLYPPALGRPRQVELTVIVIQATDSRTIDAAIGQVTKVLRRRHNLSYQENNFTVVTQDDYIASSQTITRALTFFLGAIAAISLLVGGIGIMNIMLASVAERTREIGLRKAVGARRGDIRTQFLVEALILSLVGGLIGIGAGMLIAAIGTRFLQQIAAGAQAQVEPGAVLLATGTAIAVGLIFGLYPAMRAARLNPIDALRHE